MAQTRDSQAAFSHPVPVGELPPAGVEVTLAPGEAERAALARHAGVIDLPKLTARFHLAPEGAEGVHVTGQVSAVVRQTCGVSLEPFDAPLEEAVDVHFVPAGTAVAPEEEGDEERDPPDEITGGAIDLGALMGEFLALGVDPYPRKPGVVFEAPEADDAAASPFAALARLKDRT